jgi:glycerophosphoryl diester phosphodiesterase
MKYGHQLSVMVNSFRNNWQQFLAIHVAINVLVFIVLGPLAGLLLQLGIGFSGDAALSDQDILYFLIKPVGLVSMLIVGSVFSIIIFLEHGALLLVAYYGNDRRLAQGMWLFGFLGNRVSALFSLSLRILVRVLLTILPFLLLILAVYKAFLGEYDINYYLSEKPPEFLTALLLAGLIVLALVFVLMRLFISWVYCLPLLLVNGLTPAQAMKKSKEAVIGHRKHIWAWLLAWVAATILAAASITALVRATGNLLVPLTLDSYGNLLLVLSVLSLLALLLNMVVTWLSSSFLSLLIVSLFRESSVGEGSGVPLAERDWQPLGRYFSGRNLLWALLLGLVIAALVVNVLLGRVPMEDRTEIMAHRGASAMAPENTLAAVQGAIDAGAHWVEIDVQETLDDEIVVIHDSDLKKIARQPIRVSEATLTELQTVDIGSWFGPDFSDQRIPTLKQVLELCKGQIGVNIELKYYGGERRLEESVVEIVEAAQMQDQVMVMSLDFEGMKRMRALRPKWKLGLLSSVALGKLISLDLDFLAINASSASRSRIRQTQNNGKQIAVWTVNDAVGMATMLSRGVDAIITDEPALAVSILEQRAELEPAQRLLMYLADVFDQPSLYRDQ